MESAENRYSIRVKNYKVGMGAHTNPVIIHKSLQLGYSLKTKEKGFEAGARVETYNIVMQLLKVNNGLKYTVCDRVET